MKRKSALLLLWCASVVVSGCEETGPAGDDEPEVAIDWTAEGTYTDPETGGVYDLNPNRRSPLGKGAGDGTQSRTLAGDVTEVRSAVNAAGLDIDWSGQVVTQTVECISRTQTGNISIGCTVSPNYVLVGGGAEDVSTGAGAMLWETRPQDVNDSGPGRTWLASSTDHTTPASHTLHVWAIGLLLFRTDGTALPRSETKSHISYSRVTSGVANHPSAECLPSGNMMIIGGGVRANWQLTGGAPQLLTQSLTANATNWKGGSKDHLIANPTTVDVSCISIDVLNMPGVGRLITVTSMASVCGAGPGRVSETDSLLAGSFQRSAIVGYGGEATWDGPGRMLYRISPGDGDIRSFTASTKDHLSSDTGCTYAQGIGFRRY